VPLSQHDDAVEVLEYLNLKTGRNFKPVKPSIRHLKARMSEGYSTSDIKRVIDSKCVQWIGDTRMQEFLRPKTLFAAENFSEYFGQLDDPIINQPASTKNARRKIESYDDRIAREREEYYSNGESTAEAQESEPGAIDGEFEDQTEARS